MTSPSQIAPSRRSAFRVVDNVLVSCSLRSDEVISVSATREPFECFISTFAVRDLVARCGGSFERDAPSFIAALLRSFDASVELSESLVRVVGVVAADEGAPHAGRLQLRVAVLWMPRTATSAITNAVAFDMSLVPVAAHARDSFCWTQLNDLAACVARLTRGASDDALARSRSLALSRARSSRSAASDARRMWA
jgi:hypothetical protein